MRGIAIEEFGGAETLTLRDDLPTPPVGLDTVLVRVKAAALNPVDWKIREGFLAGAFPHHFPLVPGWDLAGIVEQVGPAVRDFAVGDEVIGYVRRDDVQYGTYAELVPAPERTLAGKPAGLTMTEAAGLPLAGLTAYQVLTEALAVQPGERVLVHAASGGVGSFAVQIATALGAHVIGTASARNHGYLRDLGAAETIDYSAGPISKQLEEKADAVIDLVGGDALEDAPAQVDDPSRIVSIIDPATVLGLGGRYVFVRPSATQLSTLAAWAEDGRLRVTIGATYPLAKAAEAHRALQDGHSRGKIVLEI